MNLMIGSVSKINMAIFSLCIQCMCCVCVVHVVYVLCTLCVCCVCVLDVFCMCYECGETCYSREMDLEILKLDPKKKVIFKHKSVD